MRHAHAYKVHPARKGKSFAHYMYVSDICHTHYYLIKIHYHDNGSTPGARGGLNFASTLTSTYSIVLMPRTDPLTTLYAVNERFSFGKLQQIVVIFPLLSVCTAKLSKSIKKMLR